MMGGRVVVLDVFRIGIALHVSVGVRVLTFEESDWKRIFKRNELN